MRKTIVVLAAILMAGPAVAQEDAKGWTVIGIKGGHAMGWAASSVTKDAAANTATLKTFRYHVQSQPFPGARYNYAIEEHTFMCGTAKYRTPKSMFRDIDGNPVGTGIVNQAFDVRAGTINALLEGIACRGAVVASMNDMAGVRDIASIKSVETLEQAMAEAKAMAAP